MLATIYGIKLQLSLIFVQLQLHRRANLRKRSYMIGDMKAMREIRLLFGEA
jgi:hypothetical protein